jgi:hypothetical protein
VVFAVTVEFGSNTQLGYRFCVQESTTNIYVLLSDTLLFTYLFSTEIPRKSGFEARKNKFNIIINMVCLIILINNKQATRGLADMFRTHSLFYSKKFLCSLLYEVPNCMSDQSVDILNQISSTVQNVLWTWVLILFLLDSLSFFHGQSVYFVLCLSYVLFQPCNNRLFIHHSQIHIKKNWRN